MENTTPVSVDNTLKPDETGGLVKTGAPVAAKVASPAIKEELDAYFQINKGATQQVLIVHDTPSNELDGATGGGPMAMFSQS